MYECISQLEGKGVRGQGPKQSRKTTIDEFLIKEVKNRLTTSSQENPTSSSQDSRKNDPIRHKSKSIGLLHYIKLEDTGATSIGTVSPSKSLKISSKGQPVEDRSGELSSRRTNVEPSTNSGYKDVVGFGKTYSAQAADDAALELLREPFVESARGYLLDVRYDGRMGKAVLVIYDTSEKRLVKWIDKTMHRPYFLTDARPEDLKASGVELSRDDSFVQYDVVEKFHPIERRKVRLTKVVVSDPLAVRRMRERVKSAGFQVWEADIKYHHNYIFDRQLVPGIVYELGGGGIRHVYPLDTTEYTSIVMDVFREEPNEVKERAVEWIRVFESPPPKIPLVAVDIEVYSPLATRLPDPTKSPYPVISVAVSDSEGREKIFLLYWENAEFESPLEIGDEVEIEIFDSEKAMLLEVMRHLSKYPVILTFNGDNFDLPYLANRLRVLGVPEEFITIEKKQDYTTFKNSLHIDVHKLFGIKALQAYAFGNKYRELSLESISKAMLGKGKVELRVPVPELSIEKLAEYNLQDTRLTLELVTSNNNLVFNLVVMVMRTSKLGMEDVTRSQISNWIKGLLYWEHRRRKWLIPSREEIDRLSTPSARVTAVIKDKKYRGAIVLDPPIGVFFNVIVLDFASLYPSLIKQWNLSYETVNNPNCNKYSTIPEVGHRVCTEFRGISSEIVGLLRDFRVKLYKRKAKDKALPDVERMWYDVVQSAMKVYINASYGVFGSSAFSLYSLAVAESVTALGRAVLRSTLEKASSLDLHIVYGDTDSLFLWDPPANALEELIRHVYEEFGLELEKDKSFRAILFSGLKKNYLGITEDGGVTIKGMVAKKSNTPEFIKEEFARAVEILAGLSGPGDVTRILEELRDHVNRVYNNVRKRVYTLDEFAIKVMLSKDLDDYDKNTPQHVKAAKLLERFGVKLGSGDIVYFVKTRDKLGVKPVQLAKLSEIDPHKYMEYVKTAFEQMLMAFGVSWDDMSGTRKLDKLIFG